MRIHPHGLPSTLIPRSTAFAILLIAETSDLLPAMLLCIACERRVRRRQGENT